MPRHFKKWTASERQILAQVAAPILAGKISIYRACKNGVAALPHRTWAGIRGQVDILRKANAAQLQTLRGDEDSRS